MFIIFEKASFLSFEFPFATLPARLVRFSAPTGPVQWAHPKQTGDYFNDGLSEALIFRPELCGVDLLYNESSHWLAYLQPPQPASFQHY